MIAAESIRRVHLDLPGKKTTTVDLRVHWEEDTHGVLITGFQPIGNPCMEIWFLALEKAEELRMGWEEEIHEDLMEWRLRVYV